MCGKAFHVVSELKLIRCLAAVGACCLGWVLAWPGMARADVYWGADKNGGSGQWDDSNNWTGGIPASSSTTYFQGVTPADVTIGSGVAAQTGALYINKTTVLTLENQASLATSGTVYVPQGDNLDALSLSVFGPGSGSTATVNFSRLYSNKPAANDPAAFTTTFSGQGLTVNLGTGGGTTYLDNANVLNVLDGASVVGQSLFDVRSTDGKSARVYIQGGTLSASSFNNAGVVRLGGDGMLTGVGNTSDVFKTTSGGRFEAEGTGLIIASQINGGGTLAVGVSSVGTRSSGKTLTLNANVQMGSGGHIEFGIFGAGNNDKIDLANTGSLKGGSAIIDLVLYGYTPADGDSFTLFTGDTPNITASFDTSGIDTSVWDLSSFNEGGHWKITAVPEPAGLSLLVLGGLVLRRQRRV